MRSSRSDYNISLSSLNLLELECLLEKQTKIKEALKHKLSDNGVKLDCYIAKIRSAIEIKKKKEFVSILAEDDAKSLHMSQHFENLDYNDQSINEGMNAVEIEQQTINCGSGINSSDKDGEGGVSALCVNMAHLCTRSKNEPTEPEDFSVIHEQSVAEFCALWHALNLPCLQPKSYRWFIFSVRVVDDLAYLTVLDCASPERHLSRVGLRNIWFPDYREHGLTNSNPHLPPKRLDQSAKSVHDLWQFISTPTSLSVESTPCLICYPTGDSTTPDDLTWLSRLLRSTRHSRLARCALIPNCRFANARRALHAKMESTPLDERCQGMVTCRGDSSVVDQLLGQCRRVSELLFPQGCCCSAPTDVQIEHFASVSEFLLEGQARSLTWMEAPLELKLLRQLKQTCTEMENKHPGKPSLSRIPDCTLRLLACLGLGRTRLTRLAGLGGWPGFSAFLSFEPFQLVGAPELQVLSLKHHVLVTQDKQILADLYQYFVLIHRHMVRHERFHNDSASNRSPKTLFNPRTLDPLGQLPTLAVGQDRIEAWTWNGNSALDPMGHLQLRLINFDSSVKLARPEESNPKDDASRNRPLLTLPSKNYSRYRLPTLSTFLDEDDDDDDQDYHDALSDTSTDSDSADSLKLEDVD